MTRPVHGFVAAVLTAALWLHPLPLRADGVSVIRDAETEQLLRDYSAEGFEFLAMAYHRKGETPKAQLAAAQGLFVSGKYVEARTQASRSQAQFEEGSPGRLKADDILNYRPPKTDGFFQLTRGKIPLQPIYPALL